MERNKNGFTLLEMLVVVLIIGILAGIALPQYENSVEKSKASEALIILKSLRDQQALCYLQKGGYEAECEQGDGYDNLFTYTNVIEGDSAPDCTDILCGPATKDFSYELDGNEIYATRRPVETKYRLMTSARYDGRIRCDNLSDDKNYCKIIGFTKEEGAWYQP